MDSTDWLVTAGLVSSSVVAITANLLLLLVFCRRRSLRTVSNRFVINLLVTNLVSSILLVPFLLIDNESTTAASFALQKQHVITNIDAFVATQTQQQENRAINYTETTIAIDLISTINGTDEAASVRNKIFCYVAEGGTSLVCAASILSILLIGIDQYFAVIHSLRYHACIDKWTSMIMIIGVWIVAIVFGAIGAQNKSDLWGFCCGATADAGAAFKIYAAAYVFAYVALIILGPFVVICAIYVCIYKAARRSGERMRKSTSGNNLEYYSPVLLGATNFKLDIEGLVKLPKASSAPNFGALQNDVPQTVIIQMHSNDRAPNNGFISSLRYKLSNASNAVFRYREETRAAKISILVIFMVLFCYVPYGTALVLNARVVDVATPPLFNFLALLLLVAANIVSPFLFVYRNRRVQKEMWRLFGLVPDRRKSFKRNLNVRRNTATVLSSLTAADNFEAMEPLAAGKMTPPPDLVTQDDERSSEKSILKRVCSKGKTWTNKKCNFITLPDGCLSSAECRSSFSSASTQLSSTEE